MIKTKAKREPLMNTNKHELKTEKKRAKRKTYSSFSVGLSFPPFPLWRRG